MSFDLLNIRAISFLKLELAAILWIGSVASSCSDADLSGANRTQKTEKKEAAVVEEEGDTAVPPEVLAGAYLSCGEVEAGSPDLTGVAIPAGQEVIGCTVQSKSDGRVIDVSNYQTQWKIVAKDDREVTTQRIELRPGTRIQWAAFVPNGTISNLKAVSLDFPRAGRSIVSDSSQISEGEESTVPGAIANTVISTLSNIKPPESSQQTPPSASTDVPATACHAENDNFKSEKGGCRLVGSKLVIGKLNDDPTPQLNQSDANAKSMWFFEAEKICNDDRSGGHDDWRLPTKEELITIRNADPVGHLSFLVTEEFEKSARGSNYKYGYWSKTKKYYYGDRRAACGLAEEWCYDRFEQKPSLALSFCVREID